MRWNYSHLAVKTKLNISNSTQLKSPFFPPSGRVAISCVFINLISSLSRDAEISRGYCFLCEKVCRERRLYRKRGRKPSFNPTTSLNGNTLAVGVCGCGVVYSSAGCVFKCQNCQNWHSWPRSLTFRSAVSLRYCSTLL